VSKRLLAAMALAAVFTAPIARAELAIGVFDGSSGPGASRGAHYRNTDQWMPKALGGVPAQFLILDDASDPTNAAKNARKLVSEDKVDALMGSNGAPSAITSPLGCWWGWKAGRDHC